MTSLKLYLLRNYWVPDPGVGTLDKKGTRPLPALILLADTSIKCTIYLTRDVITSMKEKCMGP